MSFGLAACVRLLYIHANTKYYLISNCEKEPTQRDLPQLPPPEPANLSPKKANLGVLMRFSTLVVLVYTDRLIDPAKDDRILRKRGQVISQIKLLG
jgi:hypothetical protein